MVFGKDLLGEIVPKRCPLNAACFLLCLRGHDRQRLARKAEMRCKEVADLTISERMQEQRSRRLKNCHIVASFLTVKRGTSIHLRQEFWVAKCREQVIDCSVRQLGR